MAGLESDGCKVSELTFAAEIIPQILPIYHEAVIIRSLVEYTSYSESHGIPRRPTQ